MKRFIASGFGVGIIWNSIFGDQKGGGTLAPLLFTLIIYFLQLNVLELSILFIVLVLIYIFAVDDQDADEDPSWITLDEIVGMSLVSIASSSKRSKSKIPSSIAIIRVESAINGYLTPSIPPWFLDVLSQAK